MAEQVDKLLTQQQVVEWTGMSSQWFEISRHRGINIPFVGSAEQLGIAPATFSSGLATTW